MYLMSLTVFLAGMEMLIQMTKKMIEFLISGYEYYENERKSRHNEKIWLINQIKVIYWMHKKRNRVELQFCFHTVFSKMQVRYY